MSTENKKVVVFGSTGAIGSHLIETISKKQPTWQIHAVSRSSSSSRFANISNVQVVQGDPNNRDSVLSLTKDADIVYSCVGFSKYERKYWAGHWPIVVDNLLEGSSQKPNQKFVFCDNIYAYGWGENVSTSSKIVTPSTKSKPAIRALLRKKFVERIAKDPSSITIVGGADFFGPLVESTSFLGDTFTKKILAGEQAIAIASADVIHDFCYVLDFANALYTASISKEAYGKFWICPHAIHGKSLNDIAKDIVDLSSAENFKGVQVYPGWSVKLLSPFVVRRRRRNC
jgi:nucleoside-diphosphate-sugar epimerase